MPAAQPSRYVKVVLHATYFLSGIATVLIGQVLPVFANRFSLDDLHLSYFFPAQFSGSLTGTLLTSWFGRRDRYFAATMIGTLLIAGGILVMNVDLFWVSLIGFAVNGIGIGMTLPSINMLILEMNRDRSASALSVLNFCWGAGAIVSKPFVDAFATHNGLGLTTYLLAAPLIVGAVALAPHARKKLQVEADVSTPDVDVVPIWTTSIAWMIALFNFIHVGFESGIGGWLTTYTGRVGGEPIAAWISPMVLYFSFFVIGRGVAPVLFRYLSENRMLFLGLFLILAGLVIVLTASTVLGLSVGSVIAGFGTAWIFPSNVARFSHTFGPTASRRATPLFICGTLGAAWCTWLIGFVSSQTGSLRVGMYVLLVSVGLLIVLQTLLAVRSSYASRARDLR
jgi:FHS family glucose/mannose:H+ symporter-like MFS transporter